MKRKVCSLFLAVLLCLSLALPVLAAAETEFLLDEADLLSPREEAQLEEKLTELSAAYNTQLVVYTVSSLEERIDRTVNRIYDEMGMGYGDSNDGVLLLVCMDPRGYRILSNGRAFSAIGMDEIDSIGNKIAPRLTAGDYADAFDSFAEECAYYLESYENGSSFRFGKNLLICLVIGVVAGFVVTAILKGQLKTVRQQNQANVYVKPGSMQVTHSNDIFLYRNVTRVKKETSKPSGSGSSRGVGGGSF